jgi:hypothetical protein
MALKATVENVLGEVLYFELTGTAVSREEIEYMIEKIMTRLQDEGAFLEKDDEAGT